MTTTPISTIQPLWESTLLGEQTQGGPDETSGLAFSSIFQVAIDQVRQTDAEKNKTEYLLATGQLDDPSTMNIAMTQYELSVQLLIQLRNKALDAYSELTRISL